MVFSQHFPALSPNLISGAIAYDNHPMNVSSFKNLLQYFNQDPDKLSI